ncbi:hypothetical protein G3554_09150 [Micromonospora sp. PPF5-17]|uniref:PPE family protein n=1 Tax=Micromonospora solifontis TaxID=2487138 RepID=A0ABX9WJU5_9ACTN|nr:hypothetical protein [Micromonospora solifontis]NES36336.1 hypothetical protein [Micromonospora solifontis]RNL99578.1 hypothetical protein EFE23_09185 [Micromonospora solifontis]
MAGGTWERCVREVTLSADPETVGSVGVGWSNLGTGLGYLRDALIGRSFVGPIAPGTERPHTGGLTGMLAGWKGSGGDAYREHLGEIGKDIEELITHATNVSGALSRIEGDIRKAVASIPIPLMDDFGWNEWSLPGGTELDDARDGESQSGFLAALRKDYGAHPELYADGAFRDKADDLEATMKVDGNASDHKRGGWWDTKSHLDNWYRDNQQAANTAMSPLPTAVETERPKLVVPSPTGDTVGDYRPDDRKPPAGYPGGGGGGGGGIGGGGGMPNVGSTGIGGGGGSPYSGHSSIAPPPTGGNFDSGGPGGGSHTPSTGAGLPGSGTPDYGTGLAGAGAPTLGSGYGGGPGLGGIGVGGIPGMVGGGNGKVPPMTSAASALRNAAGAGAGAGGLRGAGMMGGMGGHGGAGHGGSGTEHSSWLTEDDDPWGTGDAASPGILR